MKLVVDTNIVFSAMITPRGVVGELMLFTWPRLDLFAPENLRVELSKHREKAVKAARLCMDEIVELESIVLSRVSVVPHAVVPAATWERAYDLVKTSTRMMTSSWRLPSNLIARFGPAIKS